MVANGLSSLLWFIVIIAMIPAALWLLKRTPMGGAASGHLMRSIAALPLSANQRVVTIEVGHGEARRWLVLGVTAQSITTLHTMVPEADAAEGPVAQPVTPFAQLIGKLRPDRNPPDGR